MWGDGTFLSELAGPERHRRRAAQRRGGGRGRAAGRGARTWPTPGTTACSCTAPKERCWRAGAPAAATARRAARRAPSTIPPAWPSRAWRWAKKSSTWRTRATTASSSSTRTATCCDSGARAAAPTGTSTRRPAWPWTAPATCTRSTAKTTACRQFDSDGHFLAKWGLRGTGLGDFSQPSAIAIDCAGSVYVADTNNNRVERFNPVSPAPTGCQAAGSWPPPLDVAPVLRIALPRSSGVLARRALALSVSCERGCKVLVSGTLSPRGSARIGGAGRGGTLAAAGDGRPRAAEAGRQGRFAACSGRSAGGAR